MPDAIAPMKAVLRDTPPTGPDWVFEIKWDGVRALCLVAGEQLTILSRNGNRCERQYPELHVLPHYLAADTAVLDGEIVVLDEKGVSRFELIQSRIANADPAVVARLSRSHPVLLFVFDLIYLDGYDLRQVSLVDRTRALDAVLTPSERVRLSEHFPGGEELLEAARNMGLEGILAKRAGSCYEPRRSPDWVKVKLVNQQEFLICGYTAGEREYFASLVLGAQEGGRLQWVGNVGTGFSQQQLREIHALLEPLRVARSPFPAGTQVPGEVTWVKPEAVAMIKFANWTQDGHLRAPVYLGLRHDVASTEVRGDRDEATVSIEGRRIKLTNLNKVFYPDEGYTKGDILDYYNRVADLILPHLQDRPLSLKRYPNGIGEEYFFQKNVPRNWPEWLRTVPIYHEHNQAATNYVFAEDHASLLYLVNLGCIDHNPWLSRVDSIDNPDFILIDIDPYDCPFEMIVEVAQLVHEKLDAIGLEGFPKTTGGDGMHIYIPVEPVYTYEETKTFAEILARLLAHERPQLFTSPRTVSRRQKGRVYFDYLQNGKGKTIAAPYVLRAFPKAPVATPLAWKEVRKGLHPTDFTIRNVPERFAGTGDLFEGVLTRRQRIEGALEKLQSLYR